MKKLNVHEAKTHLSRHLDEVERGEVIVLCRNNEPIAEIRALPKALGRRRAWGGDEGLFRVPQDFNAQLEEEFLSDWER